MTDHDTTPGAPETEALSEVLDLSPLRCICGRQQHDFCGTCIARYILTSDWLATRDAAQRAEAWDEGYAKCSDDFESHLNQPGFDCDCPEDPLLANPYRGAQC